MQTLFFPAIIDGSEDDGFGVSFPDLPGCVSAGTTVNEAALNAQEALQLHLDGMTADGEDIPAPSGLYDAPVLTGEPEVGRVLVPATLPGKKVRVNIMIDEGLLKAVDYASGRRNRSAFIADAIRAAIHSH